MRTGYAQLTVVGTDLAFASSYDANLVETFKARIPNEARRWDARLKVWLVSPKYASVCVDLADTYLGVQITVPSLATAPANPETRLIRLDYLARSKDRNGEKSAFGWADGGWTLIFPEAVLRRWFGAMPENPTEAPTLFSRLAIQSDANEADVRSAYRRLAKQWHPDTCREADAAAQFKAIKAAYDVLIDPIRRKKYAAGLLFERSLAKPVITDAYFAADTGGYRTPLRCGYVMVDGLPSLGRFIVSVIHAWEDVTDDQGRTMVVSWPAGADKFETIWL